MSETVIEVENVSKQYRLGAIGGGRLADDLSRWWAKVRGKEDPTEQVGGAAKAAGAEPDAEALWALRDVSFEVKRGDIVGVIGRNGAGKSTLLKILSRVTAPSAGEVRVKGRIASLLEVGTGFHPELTGRENIFLNGAILGMSKGEIRRKYEDIVEFSGIARFVDTPVKRYSSGMYVRLAFAVAAHLEPEILIVDEVLAVGDAEFQAKCLGKMKDVASHGRTVLFVSHNMGAVRTLCTRGIVFRQGRRVFDGPVVEAVREYSGHLERNAGLSLNDPERSGTGGARLVRCRVVDENGQPLISVTAGTPVGIELGYQVLETFRTMDVVMTLFDGKGMAVTNFSTSVLGATIVKPGKTGTIVCRIPKLPLLPGKYRAAIALQSPDGTLDLAPAALILDVESSVFFPGGRVPDGKFCACMVEHEWKHETHTPAPDRTDAGRMSA